MKKNLFLVAISLFGAQLFSQTPKVYIHLNSHNEATITEPYDGATRDFYDTAYKYIKRIADVVISKNAKYNFQSDVGFLLGCLKYDLHAATTNSLNILKWMDDSPNIECDPHSHEAKYGMFFYNYADCAHLHDSLGVTDRKNVGGFKLDGLQNGYYWLDMEAGINGTRYSTAPVWKPNVLWGGSYNSGTHNDVNTFGYWKPQDSVNYGTHVNTRRLRMQGNGCSMVLHDTTDEQRIIREVVKIFKNVNNGSYPSNQMYNQIVQFNCRNMKNQAFVDKISTVIDSINKYVIKGWAVWKTITEKDQVWHASPYDSLQYRIDCVDLPTSIEDNVAPDGLQIYPNPVKDKLYLRGISKSQSTNFIVYDVIGSRVFETTVEGSKNTESIDLSFLSSGCYILHYRNNRIKFVKE